MIRLAFSVFVTGNLGKDRTFSALERAERVLSHLLVLARVDASAGASTLTAVDLVATAKDLVSEMVPTALAQSIDLGFEGPDTAEVAADPILLAELLRNLVSNAITYAGRGALVTVRIVAQPDHVLLEVEDNGPGLSEQQMATAVQSRRGSSRPLPSPSRYQPCLEPDFACKSRVRTLAWWPRLRSTHLPNDC